MPLFGVILVFLNYPLPHGFNTVEIGKILFLLLFFNTIILPSIAFYTMYKTKLITNMELHKREERFLPFLATLFFYGITYGFLRKSFLPEIVFVALSGTLLVLVTVIIISLSFKISIHLSGIGGILGLLIGSYFASGGFNPWLTAAIVLACGLTAWSRLYLEAHKPSEVYVGFCCGFLLMFGISALGIYF